MCERGGVGTEGTEEEVQRGRDRKERVREERRERGREDGRERRERQRG